MLEESMQPNWDAQTVQTEPNYDEPEQDESVQTAINEAIKGADMGVVAGLDSDPPPNPPTDLPPPLSVPKKTK